MDLLAFVLKKVVSRLLFPLELILGLGLAGLLLLGRRRPGRWGLRFLWGAWLLLLLLSVPALTYLLLAPLEQGAGDYANPAHLAAAGVEHIVVLGGGVGQGRLTTADRLHGASMLRLMEGLRLLKALPGCKLVVSGGGHRQGVTVGQAMRDLALDLGVPAQDLILENQSWDTEDEARVLAGLLGRRPFALVTSAFHLRRSLAFFKAHGLNPLPAPADFRTRGFRLDYDTLLPQTGSLHGAEIAFYEYLGHLWLKLKYWNGPPVPPAKAPGGA